MGEITIIIAVIIILIMLIYLSGWFSSTETAFTNLNLVDITHLDKKLPNTKYILFLKENLDSTLVSILIMNNIINVLISIIPVVFLGVFLNEFILGILISTITFIIILFGDIIPKSRAIYNKNRLVERNAKILYYIFILTKPLVKILIYLSKYINSISGYKERLEFVIDDKTIKEVVNMSHKDGKIKRIEKKFISNILEFGDLKVKDILIKKENVFFFSENYSIYEAREKISKKPFTRIPYIEEKKVLGIVYAKDLLKENKKKISTILRKPFIVNENLDISNLFKKMKENKIHIAIVYNDDKEYVGIITLEDILETIIGSINDEYYYEKK